MKQITTVVILLFISLVSHGQMQDFEGNKAFTVISSPGSYNDGANLGIQYEGMNTLLYYGAEVFAHPWLNSTGEWELPYYHLIGRFGFNHYFGRDPVLSTFRIFAGGRAGGILRTGEGAHAMMGLEIGVDIILTCNIFGRISATTDSKTDSQIWSNKPHHTTNSVIVGVGYKF